MGSPLPFNRFSAETWVAVSARRSGQSQAQIPTGRRAPGTVESSFSRTAGHPPLNGTDRIERPTVEANPGVRRTCVDRVDEGFKQIEVPGHRANPRADQDAVSLLVHEQFSRRHRPLQRCRPAPVPHRSPAQRFKPVSMALRPRPKLLRRQARPLAVVHYIRAPTDEYNGIPFAHDIASKRPMEKTQRVFREWTLRAFWARNAWQGNRYNLRQKRTNRSQCPHTILCRNLSASEASCMACQPLSVEMLNSSN